MDKTKDLKDKTREEHRQAAIELLRRSSEGQPAVEHLVRAATAEALLGLFYSEATGGTAPDMTPVVETLNRIEAKLSDLIKVTAKVEARLNQNLNVTIIGR